MEENAKWYLPQASIGVNRTLYFFRGSSLSINGSEISPYHSIELRPDMNAFLENGPEECQMLMLQGKPIDEPVVQYGPFVMNTNQEIQEAMNDYQKDQFGGWPWPTTDPVHARDKGRFAKHADGKLETKDL